MKQMLLRLSYAFLSVFLFLLTYGVVGAEDVHSEKEHSEHAKTDKAPDLSSEVIELRAKIARLEAALEYNHKTSSSSSGQERQKMQMGMHGKMKGMEMKTKGGMMSGNMMKGMKMGSMGMMGMMENKNMGMMGKMNKMEMGQSSLPGFPGISHLYHIGAKDFFLDHAEHLALSPEQKQIITQLREKFASHEADLDRQIEESEGLLWELTAEGEPDAKSIEEKIRKIEKLKANKRIEFIRAVGRAASQLTDVQRATLVGAISSDTAEKLSGNDE